MTYILGTGISSATRPEEKSLNDLVFEAAAAALEEAGLSRADVDGVCVAASDQLDGRAISSMLLACPAGAYLRDEVKVSDESALALPVAAMRLEAGIGRHALVVSWTKSSESPPDAAAGVNPEPILTRGAGLHPLCAEAAVCGALLARHSMDRTLIDAVARERSTERHIEDRIVAWPLRAIHVPPPTDGAAAIILSTEARGVEVAAWAFASDHHDPSRRKSDPVDALSAITQQASAAAGVQVSASIPVETTDRNTYRLFMAAAGLGLVDIADAPAAFRDGTLSNVNRSGGLWSSNPVAAAGLERVVHAVRHLHSNGSDIAVAHSSYGYAGQGQFVSILRRVS